MKNNLSKKERAPDRYFMSQGIDAVNLHLLAFSSYNAGPARVGKFRKEARENGLDPNRWFNNMELIAETEKKENET